jgi:1-acyl-sn-glycerol-3-phosphate acyltransferase
LGLRIFSKTFYCVASKTYQIAFYLVAMALLSTQIMTQLRFPETSIATYQPTTSRCSPLLTPLAYFLGEHIVMPLYFDRITVSGQENLPTEGPVILAPTHRARWDSIVLPLVAGRSVTGRDLRFMVTADEVKGLQGWLIRRLGGFAVNVRHPSVSSLRHGIDLLLQRAMLVIYPEGGIFRDRQVHRLKPGLARLALQAEALAPDLGIQIVPVSLHYDAPFPGWRSNIHVTIGQPIPVSSYKANTPTAETIKVNAKRLTADLQQALQDLVEEEEEEGAIATAA